jgi:hypothetical protein
MYTLIKYYKNTLFAVLCLSLLAGCGGPMIATERPFSDPLASMTPGQTTREDVHTLLGEPMCCTNILWPSRDEGRVEVYRTWGDALGLAGFVPVPSGDLTHYALITYDASGRVNATDWDYAAGASDVNLLYAGEYGYFPRLDTIFPSIDGGGKTDRAWVKYMKSAQGTRMETHKKNINTLKLLCRAAEQGHPAAFNELGNFFWYDLNVDSITHGQLRLWSMFEKDKVKACLWYSMANEKVQPPWCRDWLTVEESTKVEHLLENWQPSQCDPEIMKVISGN